MGVYVIANCNGSYIRKDDASGKYVPIRSLKKAAQWDSAIKANKVLNNSVSKNIRSDFTVKLIETDEIVEKECLTVQNDICLRDIENDNIDEWLKRIETVIEAMSESDSRQQELNGKLSNVDKEIVDIEHYIEFGKFNAYQGWMCFKMLQSLLKQRRKYKNEIQVLSLIRQCKFDKPSMISLYQTISDIQNKCYTPRAFPELFKSGN